jgi:hypothetical protein
MAWAMVLTLKRAMSLGLLIKAISTNTAGMLLRRRMPKKSCPEAFSMV